MRINLYFIVLHESHLLTIGACLRLPMLLSYRYSKWYDTWWIWRNYILWQ